MALGCEGFTLIQKTFSARQFQVAVICGLCTIWPEKVVHACTHLLRIFSAARTVENSSKCAFATGFHCLFSGVTKHFLPSTRFEFQTAVVTIISLILIYIFVSHAKPNCLFVCFFTIPINTIIVMSSKHILYIIFNHLLNSHALTPACRNAQHKTVKYMTRIHFRNLIRKQFLEQITILSLILMLCLLFHAYKCMSLYLIGFRVWEPEN